MKGAEPCETVLKEITEEGITKSTEEISPEKVEIKPICTQDYVLAVLTCLGLFVTMGMRCNLGPGFDVIYNKDFSQIPIEVVLIDGAFHVGYIAAQIPAGILCFRISSNKFFITSIITSAFINLILPGAVNLGDEFLMALRFLQGGLEGAVIPALYRVWGLTISETKAFLISIAFSGCLLGFALSFPVSQYLSRKFSWEATFYFYGALAIIWCGIWSYFVSEKSSNIKHRLYHVIVPSVKEHEPIPIPYSTIFKSRPLWALSSVTTSCLLSVYIFITTLNVYSPSPQYHFFTYEFTFSILCMVMCAALLITGFGSDFLFQRNILSLNTIRKVTVCGSIGALLPISLITHITRSPVLVTTAYSCSSFLFGTAICGILVNCLDLGKQFAALSSAFISFCSFLACMLIYVMKVQFSSHEKSTFSFIVFIATVQILGLFLYAVYGSSHDQYWDLPLLPKDFVEESDDKKPCEGNSDVKVDVDESKIPHAKIHDSKIPHAKIHDSKVHDSKVHDSKVYDTKIHDAKIDVVDESRIQDANIEESMIENLALLEQVDSNGIDGRFEGDGKKEDGEVERLPVIVEGVEYHHKIETPQPELECGNEIEERKETDSGGS